MSTKFTPGPWSVGVTLNGNWIEFGPDQKAVARTFHTHVGVQIEDANAHLIAAAPELYDAVQTAIAEFEAVAPDAKLARDRLYRISDEMRALLAKARGKA